MKRQKVWKARWLCVLFIITNIFSVPVMANTNTIKVICDGVEIKFDQPPIIDNDRVMVPIRFVAEAIGWEVNYGTDGIVEISQIIIGGNKKYFTFIDIDNANIRNFISVNQVTQVNETKEMNPEPKIVNGRTLVGVRQLAEALHAQVDWDGATKTVIITTKPLPYTNEIVSSPVENNTSNTNDSQDLNMSKNNDTDYEQQRLEWELEVIKLVNEERAKEGLSEVAINEDLMEVARWRAEELYEYKADGHLSPTLNLEHTALVQYFGIDCVYAGENMYALHDGVVSSSAVMILWMNSSGHRAHILNPRVKEIGVGYHKGCWCLFLMY